MLYIVSEALLDEWVRGNVEKAPGLVTDLVYRLIAASCPNPIDRRFPQSDSINQAGPDGVLSVDDAYEPFVPRGHSYWELGSGERSQQKASEDYRNCTQRVPRETRKVSTFVFVTPRSGKSDWQYAWKRESQNRWIEERRKRKEWKDVRVIDGTKLIDWIRHFPAIESWLAIQMSSPQMKHVKSPENMWKLTESFGQPHSLVPNLFLSNRDDACQSLQEVFDGKMSHLRIVTRYPSQVVDFVCAYLASLQTEHRAYFGSRCLIISDISAWNTICEMTFGERLFLITDSALDLNGKSGNSAIQKARNAGHSVVFHAPFGGMPSDSDVNLKSPKSHQIKEDLLKSGLSEQKAQTLAYRCGRNLNYLLRQLQGHLAKPNALSDSDIFSLTIAVLVGSWNHESEADQSAICQIAGFHYEEWIESMRRMSNLPNPTIVDLGGEWRFVTRLEGFYTMGEELHRDLLERFFRAAALVLKEKDPQFELPPEERMTSSLRGMVLQHSAQLRKGIAESLAILGNHTNSLSPRLAAMAKYRVRKATRDILVGADWKLWASLSGLLPLLAEAAPDEFLEAVEDALSRTSCPFVLMFDQEDSMPLGNNYITGLLWALESLAWEKEFLFGTCSILGKLARLDPGGNWANRPSNSLARVLSPMHPQTTAPIASRLKSVQLLTDQSPLVAWDLLLSFVPVGGTTVFPTHRPAWREGISEDWKMENVSQEDYYPMYKQQYNTYTEMLVDMATSKLERVSDQDFLDRLFRLPQHLFDNVVKYLTSEEMCNRPETDRAKVWIGLLRFNRPHKELLKEKESVNKQKISEIDVVIEKMYPQSPNLINQVLFSSEAYLLFEEQEDWQETERITNDLRKRAVESVVSSSGIDEVLKLAKTVEYPDQVGFCLSTISTRNEDSRLLPSLLEVENSSLRRFAWHYVRGSQYHNGWKWVDNLNMAHWNLREKAQFLSCLPFEDKTWLRAKDWLGKREETYWRIASPNPYNSQADIELAIDKLIEYGRPKAALWCVWVLLKKGTFHRQQAISSLLAALSSDEEYKETFSHMATDVIKKLQSNLLENRESLWEIEWSYLGLLDHYRGNSPASLEYRLATDPDFYCKVIQTLFRPEGVDSNQMQLSDQEEAVMTNTYNLLFHWNKPPGSNPDKSFYPDIFIKWIEKVREICGRSGHLKIALEQAGEVLAHYPPDPDGFWIHEAVAKALNDEEAEDMRRGFQIGISNKRGVRTIDPTGKPERDSAEEYRKKAEEIDERGFYVFAKTLRNIAEMYDWEAEHIIAEEEKTE